ncbi:DNA-binding transcriptional ArsR family regulator [Mycolicibacterium iranicum]|uniref:DNA-binding transcriptional ArsR family regulator n=1 Tax=Mycolicibacterium iranicum TaxID=912594 RepID=A0A839QBV4_MYCIR|nr:metalloregulator ArsR/SmtB family transcription factor [Mycolicibacterium iranicum]MBB2993430.1 DNA-binding transcriptional ArsR family regulator [Mycolicibacterium iranicum]
MTSVSSTASVFDALGDPHRLRMVIRLCEAGPSSTLRLAQSIDLSRQAATKHLEILQAVGVVSSAKRGRERIWNVERHPLTSAGDYLQQLSLRWDRAIGRLRTLVEE